MPIRIRCRCGKGIKVRDSAAGKRVRCPQCGKPVLIPEPDYDDVPEDSWDDPYGGDPLPSAASRGGARKKSRRKAPATKSWLPLAIIGGVVLGSLVIGGVLYAVFSGSSGSDGSSIVTATPAPETPSENPPTFAGQDAAGMSAQMGHGGNSGHGAGAGHGANAGVGGNASHNASQSSVAEPASSQPPASTVASTDAGNFWVVLSDFQQVNDPSVIGNSYQVNYRIASGKPEPSRQYVVYIGSSMGVMERYNEVEFNPQNNGTVQLPAGIGMSTNVRAYVAWKKGHQDWVPVSGEIAVGAAPTVAQRPPTVQEAAGSAAQGKVLALANARFENSRIGSSALVVDYVLQQPFNPGKRYFLVVSGQGDPIQSDITTRLMRAQPGETDQIAVSLLPGRDFPVGNLTVHVERRTGMMIRGDVEVVSNSATVRR